MAFFSTDVVEALWAACKELEITSYLNKANLRYSVLIQKDR